jgi:hypothetical protein
MFIRYFLLVLFIYFPVLSMGMEKELEEIGSTSDAKQKRLMARRFVGKHILKGADIQFDHPSNARMKAVLNCPMDRLIGLITTPELVYEEALFCGCGTACRLNFINFCYPDEGKIALSGVDIFVAFSQTEGDGGFTDSSYFYANVMADPMPVALVGESEERPVCQSYTKKGWQITTVVIKKDNKELGRTYFQSSEDARITPHYPCITLKKEGYEAGKLTYDNFLVQLVNQSQAPLDVALATEAQVDKASPARWSGIPYDSRGRLSQLEKGSGISFVTTTSRVFAIAQTRALGSGGKRLSRKGMDRLAAIREEDEQKLKAEEEVSPEERKLMEDAYLKAVRGKEGAKKKKGKSRKRRK